MTVNSAEKSDVATSVRKEAAARAIRGLVFAGELRRGAKIDQDALADHLGMSKLPVREALISLAGEGIIETIPRRGAFVALDPRDGAVRTISRSRRARSVRSTSSTSRAGR